MLKKIKCIFGVHAVPKNVAFHDEMGAVFAGGICPHCGKLVQRKFIQNIWTEEVKHDNVIELRGFDITKARQLGYRVFPLGVLKLAYQKGTLRYDGNHGKAVEL